MPKEKYVCIDIGGKFNDDNLHNNGKAIHLTVNKIYNVLYKKKYILVEFDDLGVCTFYSPDRFITLNEYRINQIDRLL